jgi:hypothetical protein
MKNGEPTQLVSSSFQLLFTNDSLLKTKFDELQFPEYKEDIEKYFKNIFSLPTNNSEDLTISRAEAVTRALNNLWVVHLGKNETFQIIANLGKLEGTLFDLKNYRGHYIHQFNVFLIGHYLLNMIMEKERVRDIFKKCSNRPNFTWVLTSTFHDIGYPMERIDQILEGYFEMFLKVDLPYKIEIERLLTPVFFEYIKYLAEIQVDLKTGKRTHLGEICLRDWNFHSILLKNLRKKDHGIISAISLIHSLLTVEKLAEDKDWYFGTFPNEIMPACHAIAIHNLRIKDMKIYFNTQPFAFLLRLCDEIQDWGRSSQGVDQSALIQLETKLDEERPIINLTLRTESSFFEPKNKDIEFLKNQLQAQGMLVINITIINNQTREQQVYTIT